MILRGVRNMYGLIYKFTNKINGKIYVGQTKETLQERVRRHKKDKSPTKFLNALRFYGIQNFNIEKIDDANSIEELNNKEIFWIKKLKTFGKNGYNLTKGGKGTSGYKVSIKTKQKISKKVKEYLKLNGHPLKGVKRTFEQKEKQRISMSKKKYLVTYPNGNKKIITNLLNFCKENNLNNGHMFQICKNKKGFKSCKGFKCQYN